MEKLICEEFFTDFVLLHNGLSITRKHINVNNYDFKTKNTFVCLTGYSKILKLFFTNLIYKFMSPVVVIIIESDVVELEQLWLENLLIRRCYIWNKPFIHNKLISLPIGLNYYRHYNGIINWLKINNKPITNHSNILCLNHSPHTNTERGKLVEYATKNWMDFCNILPFIPPEKSYWKKSEIEGKIKIDVSNIKCYDEMRKYKFILSPAGAGIDCHRTWEALYIGCIPIVLNSIISDLYQDLPIVVVNDWSILTKQFLEEKYKEIEKNKKENKYNLSKLYLNYWTDKIIN